MSREQGFTLIEVMITVAIVAILAAIAVPQYSEYVMRARITEAVSQLSDMRVKMERYFQDNRSFTPPGPALPPCAAGTVAPLPTSPNFTYACGPFTANTYVITATGVAGGPMAAFSYSVTQANVRTTLTLPAGWTVTPGCWVLKRDGSC